MIFVGTISFINYFLEELWLHIRSLGNWTNKLHEYFYDYSKFNHQNAIYRKQNIISNLFRDSRVSSGNPNYRVKTR